MVSIIIPVYNAEKFIAETISSVINQEYKNWELIIIDDGSTDNSLEIIKEFVEKDERITCLRQTNSGVSSARNRGINIAKGDYISFLDADDCWKNDNIQKRLVVLEDNNVDWIFGSLDLIDENSNSLHQIIEGNDGDILNSLVLWNSNVITTPSTITLKIKCIENLRFDVKFSTAADQDFVFNLAANFNGKYYTNPSVRYRLVENSMSTNIKLMEKDHLGVYKKALDNKLFKNFRFKQKCFSNLYLILAGSWWKNEGNKMRGIYFVFKAFFVNPTSIFKLIKKI
jgi:glycosyltransferase involved in cell wall biosynthesis